MANAERQMPKHVEVAYRDAVDNVVFLKRQQWLATNYVLLLYAAICNQLTTLAGLVKIGLAQLQLVRSLSTGGCCTYFKPRSRSLEIAWLDLQYLFHDEERGIDVLVEPKLRVELRFIWFLAVSFVGAVLTAIYLWSVR